MVKVVIKDLVKSEPYSIYNHSDIYDSPHHHKINSFQYIYKYQV